MLLGLLDQGEDVTEIEDSARHPVGVERFEVVEALPRRGEHDRATGDGSDAERSSTAGISVELRQHDPREVDALLKGAGSRDGILSDHRVNDEQHFVGVDGLSDVRGLLHQFGVDAEASGRIDDDHVVLLVAGELDRVSRNAHRVAHTVARLGRIDRRARLPADDLQLLNSVGALQIGRDQKRGVILFGQPLGELARESRLARTLEAREHDDGRRVLGELEAALPVAELAAEDRDELVVDDLHDLLCRVERPRDLVAECTLAHSAGELFDHFERDVGIEQCPANFAHGAVDIRGAELALAAKVLERIDQAVGEVSKSSHGASSLTVPVRAEVWGS